MTLLEAWLARKLARRRLTLREAREVSYVHERAMGGRRESAGVTMRFEAAADFAFESDARWPENEAAESYVQSVLDGVLDELLARDVGPVVMGVRVRLLAIEWHAVDSSRRAFYFAARGAVRRGLGLGGGTYNADLRSGAG